MADVIKSFQVLLSYTVNKQSAAQFAESIEKTSHLVRNFAVGVVGFMASVEESVRRTAVHFENLFYLSQQTGVAVQQLQAVEFAFGQIGLSAKDADTAISSLQSSLLDRPGLRNLAGAFTGATTPKEILDRFRDQYAEVLKMGGQAQVFAEAQLRRRMRRFGIDPDMERQRALNRDQEIEWSKKAEEIYHAFGLNSELAAKQSVSVMNDWRLVWEEVKTGFNVLSIHTMPLLDKLFKDFAHWLAGPGAEHVKRWTKILDDWINDPETIPKIEKFFSDIGTALGNVATEIEKAFTKENIEKFNKALDQLDKILVFVGNHVEWIIGLFVAGLGIKAVAAVVKLYENMKKIAMLGGGMGAGGPGGGAAAKPGSAASFKPGGRTNIGGWLAFLPWLAAAYEVANADAEDFDPNSAKNKKKQADIQKSLDETTGGWFSKIFGAPGRAHDAIRNWFSPDRPHSYGGSPIPGIGAEGDLNLLLQGFQHWWSGSEAFHPYVMVVPAFWERLIEAIRDALNLKADGTPRDKRGGSDNTGAASSAGTPPSQSGTAAPPASGGGPIQGEGTTWYTGSAPAHFAEGHDQGWQKGGFNFAGIRAPSRMGGFRTYASEFAGVADAARLLMSSTYAGGGIDTMRGIIQKWAPLFENPSQPQMMRRAQAALGDIDKHLNLQDPAILAKVLDVMQQNEFGGRRNVSPEKLQEYATRYLGGEQPGGGMGPKPGAPVVAGDQPGGPLAGGPGTGRVRWDPGRVDMSKVRPALAETLKAASAFMPEGYSIVATAGQGGPAQGHSPGSQHISGNAMDVKILYNGQPIPNRGADVTGMYTRLAHEWYQQVLKLHPELASKAAWGGEFGTSRANRYEPDLMHFDFGGRAHRAYIRQAAWMYADKPGTTTNNQVVTVNVNGTAHPDDVARHVVRHIHERRQAQITGRNARTAIG